MFVMGKWRCSRVGKCMSQLVVLLAKISDVLWGRRYAHTAIYSQITLQKRPTSGPAPAVAATRGAAGSGQAAKVQTGYAAGRLRLSRHCRRRAGSGPAPAPDSAGASRIAAGLCPPHVSSIVIYYFLFTYCFILFILIPPLNARVLLSLHGKTVTSSEQSKGLQSWNKSVQIKKTCTLLCVCMCNCPFFVIAYTI